MSYEPRDLLDLLNADFEFDRSKAFEFGWCNILEAEDRDYRNPVWLYYPRADIWANSAARKSLTRQMTAYHDSQDHRTLPHSLDLLSGKAAGGAVVLVTARSPDSNVLQKEREEVGVDWATRDTFDFPDKLGAMRRFVEGFALMHGSGMVHGSVGFQTVSIRDQAGSPQFLVDYLNFSEIGDKQPKPSVFAEPAFSAPEIFASTSTDGKLPYSTVTDVYGIAKFLIYALLGPSNFLTFFLSTDDTPAPGDGDMDRLFDNVLWANSAHVAPDNGVQRLQKLSGNRISNELAELLNRSITVDPAQRPANATMFYEGLRSVMSGSNESAGAAPAAFHVPVPEAPASKAKYYIAGGVVLALVLGGGGFMLKKRSDQQALDARISQTTRTCQGFLDRVTRSRQTGLPQTTGWADIERLEDRVMDNGADPEKLGETVSFCEDGSRRIVAMQGDLVAALRDQVGDEANLAADSGTDLAPLRIDDQRAAADAFQQNGDFPGTEGALSNLIIAIVTAHDAQLGENIDAQMAVMDGALVAIQPDAPEEETLALIASVADIAAQPATPDAVREKVALVEELGLTAQREMTRVLFARDAVVLDYRTELFERGADMPGTGYAEFDAAYAAIGGGGPLPEEAEQFSAEYAAFDAVITQGAALIAKSDQLEAELPQLEGAVVNQIELIEDYEWDGEGDLGDLIDTFDATEPVNIHSDHLFLSEILAGLTAQTEPLIAEWDAGRATCQAMFDTVTGIAGLDDTAAWPDLSRIMADVRRFDTPDARREDFARCAQAEPLVEQGRVELRMQDLMAEVAQSRADVETAGAGEFLPAYVEAAAAHDALLQAPIPIDEASYAPVSNQAVALLGQFDDAAAMLDRARRDNARLLDELSRVQALIDGSELAAHPAYGELTLMPLEGDVLAQNAALIGNIDAMVALLRAFEAGDLLDCTINGYEMVAVAIPAEGVAQAYATLSSGAAFAGPAEMQPGTSVRACLSLHPVTLVELEAYKQTLRARNYEITAEIDEAQETAQGSAGNISYWLAERFAEFVGADADMPVCVAPAYATAWAADGTDGFASDRLEISSDACTGDNVVSQNITLGESGGAACAPVNARQSGLTFRLAAGDLCQ